MSQISETDEAFIQKFIELSTEDLDSSEVVIPQKATSSTDWELCLLARIVTDRTVLDGPFAKAMINAWGADPTTSMRQVTKNYYLFEFTCLEDLHSAQLGGVWTYKGDLVALKQVTSDIDLNPAIVTEAVVWVLLLNLPINAFNDEGIQMIAADVGIPVSLPVKGFMNGRRFTKVKILVPIGESVKDKVKATHPTLGQITVYCSYEKIAHISRFCGRLGHEMAGCQDHARLAMLIKKPGQANRFKNVDLLTPKKRSMAIGPGISSWNDCE